MSKKAGWGILAAALIVMMGVAAMTGGAGHKENEAPTSIRIGVALYRDDDTFISTLREQLERCAKDYEQSGDVKVNLDIYGAKGSQITQNSQVERFISLDCDVLCVNIVDRAAASSIIDKAMAADTPVVFFNREPVEEDMNRWEKLYYVGEDAKTSARIQGQIVVDEWKKEPALLDRNGDGVVGYVLLEGETSHQDSLIRTEWSIQTLKNGGVPLKKITGGIGNWERTQGSALMEQWLKNYPGEIELVVSNNDDMALGAIDAIKRMEIKEKIQIVGIDGTPPALAAVEAGDLLGTVQCDGEKYAKAIFDISAALALHEDVNSVINLDEGKYYRCPQISKKFNSN
ncbi:MAG: galactose ABC transporter substrate-binding protein [Clostridium sp.]